MKRLNSLHLSIRLNVSTGNSHRVLHLCLSVGNSFLFCGGQNQKDFRTFRRVLNRSTLEEAVFCLTREERMDIRYPLLKEILGYLPICCRDVSHHLHVRSCEPTRLYTLFDVFDTHLRKGLLQYWTYIRFLNLVDCTFSLTTGENV